MKATLHNVHGWVWGTSVAFVQEYLIDKFKEVQQQQRTAVTQEFSGGMDKMETKLLKLCDSVTQRANVPDLTTMESLEQYLLVSCAYLCTLRS